MGRMSTLISATLLAAASGSAWAQFNPGAGQWGKTDPTDLRVMTYNIQDALCSTSTTNNSPTTSATDWQALAREPTPSAVLMLAETVEQLMDELNGRERDMLALSLQGYTPAEISPRVGRTERTVQRVLKRIRQRLERMHADGA